MPYFVLAGVIALIALGFAYEQTARRRERQYPLPGRLVDVGGYRLHVTESGKGAATVLILHGAGEMSYSWCHVQAQLSESARVIAFDRPGLGSSGPGPLLGTDTAVAEIHSLLTTLGINGPVVLVGHSLGGLIARLYALRHPADVAGIVFVDSTHEALKDDARFRQGFAAIGTLLKLFRFTAPIGLPRFLGQVLGFMPLYPERACLFKQITPAQRRAWEAAFYRNCAGRAGAAEFAAVFPMLAEADRLLQSGPVPQLGQLPIAVLTNPGFGESWIAMHKELASRSTNSVHWISDQSGHNLHMPRPDLVVNAVHHVLDQIPQAVAAGR